MRKFLFSILPFILLLSGCNNKAVENSNKISLADVQSITIKALPSPPQIKTIDKKQDIETIINHINSINKKKVKQKNIKGWQFLIQTKGKKYHSITFISNLINIDGTWYKINDNEIKKFTKLFNNL